MNRAVLTIPLRRFIPRFRFSLRTMMIVFTVVGVVLGIWGKRYYDLRLRYEAAQQLKSIGFQVLTRSEFSKGRFANYNAMIAEVFKYSEELKEHDYQLGWDRFWFGEKYADPVIAITWSEEINDLPFRTSRTGNRGLLIGPANQPATNTNAASVNVQGLIAVLKDVRRINLNSPLPNQNTDISFIASLPNLREVKINFKNAKATDRFIDELTVRSKLKSLSLQVGGISPPQMKKLILRSPELEDLSMSCASFDATCIEPIRSSKLTNLKLDNYSGSKAQQDFIEEIARGRKWERLQINGVTDIADDTSLSTKEIHFNGSQIEDFICDSIDSVSIENDTNLLSANFSKIDRLVLKNNPKLGNIAADRWKKFATTLTYSGRIGGLKYFELDGSPLLVNLNCHAYEAVLKNLSGMKNLVIRQCTLLEHLPQVTGITVRFMDVRLAKMLAKLPALRRVDFYGEGKFPPQLQPNSLRELSKSTTVQDLLIQFEPDHVAIVGSEFEEFRELYSLEIFHFSKIFKSESPEFPISLPSNLKKLYIRASNLESHSRIRELVQTQHPNIDVTISQ